MKKIIFLCLAMLLAAGGFAQQTWTKGSGNVSLYSATDKVGIGTTNAADKFAIKSLAGETPLNLIGYAPYAQPFIKLSAANGTPFFRLYARNEWWVIGNSFDSTTAVVSAKPSRNWLRWNAAASFTGLKTPYLWLPFSAAPAVPIEKMYLSSSDSTLKYHDGTTVQTVATVSQVATVAHDSAVAYKRPYRVYTAILNSHNIDTISSGSLIIGETYVITSYNTNDDFTNVGASSNAQGVSFIATGTTPSHWDHASKLLNSGNPIPIILENSIGNIVWQKATNGIFHGTLTNAFALNNTFLSVTQNQQIVDPDKYTYSFLIPNVNTVELEYASPILEQVAEFPLSSVCIEIRVYD